ncbi:fructose-specific PTS transporter subunit EIIC [Lacticaseibacillus manihotivorans]|uniref:fructose-specific PTS transporter subunit EIIC n=1 Tax=Lacticaseibacillus manihotivorans TaxID=88233 RepID=UPI000B2F1D12|nr:fructose-specific PTS transporter subunit EIIC [Lacticaseibacillus manihotivorans]
MLSANIGAGFIGGILSGLLAGIVVFYLKKIKVTKNLQSIMPILVIPLLSTLVVGGIMVWGIGKPIAGLMSVLTKWLSGLGTGNTIVLGLILGAMIGSDMGGPVNKVAFSFGSALVGTIDKATGLPSHTAMLIMAGIGVAICVPPLAMGLATLIAPKKFTPEEKDSGKAALVMGMVGITEGGDSICSIRPLRTIPLRVDTLNNKSVISRGCFE